MRKRVVAALLALDLLASCGGGDGGGGTSGPAPTPSPAPSPTPSPTPSPSPTFSYPTVAQLSGDQRFSTACGAYVFDGAPGTARPVSPFGQGLTLDYAASRDGWTVSSDGFFPFFGQPRSYEAADRDANAPAGVRSYVKTINNFMERLTFGANTAAGTAPDYVRGFSLRVPFNGESRPGATAVQYSCVYGIPTRITDRPSATQITFTRTGFNGVAYVGTGPGALDTYALSPSQIDLSVDLVANRVTATVRLRGSLVNTGGTSSEVTPLGTYTSTIEIDERGFYNGLLRSADRDDQGSTFGGWFFGPQGAEAAFSVGINATDRATGKRIAAIGNALALR